MNLVYSLVCKATAPVYAKCGLCALLQWESNCFINQQCNLVTTRGLGSWELAGLLRLAFTKHTLSHFYTHYPKDSIFRLWNGGCHGDWCTPLRQRSHIIPNPMALRSWETPACVTFTHTFIYLHTRLYTASNYEGIIFRTFVLSLTSAFLSALLVLSSFRSIHV